MIARILAEAGKVGLEITAVSKHYPELYAMVKSGKAVKAHGIYYSRDAAYSILWDCYNTASRLWMAAGCPSGPLEVAHDKAWSDYHSAEPRL